MTIMASAESSGGGPLRPVLLSLANGGLAPAWDCPDLEGWHMEAGRDEVIRFFREREAYLDKEIRPMPTTPEPDGEDEPDRIRLHPIIAHFDFGDRVRVRDAMEGEVGRVIRISARPGGEARYLVRWVDSRETSWHYYFELEDAE